MASRMSRLLVQFMFIVLCALQAEAAAAGNPTMGTPSSGGCDKKMVWTSGQGKSTALDSSQLSDRLVLSNNVFRFDQTVATKTLSSTQSTHCYGFKTDTLSWATDYSFLSAPGKEKNPKAYANVLWKDAKLRPIKTTKSIFATWQWKMTVTREKMRCYLFFRFLTSKKAGCTGQGNDCAQTIVRIFVAVVERTAVGKFKKHIVLNSRDGKVTYNFDLLVEDAIDGNPKVYSLIPPSKTQYDNFDADLYPVLTAIRDSDNTFLFNDLGIEELRAGVEVWEGAGTVNTPVYKLEIK